MYPVLSSNSFSPSKKKGVICSAALALAILGASPALAQVPQSVHQSCMICHGQTGENTIYPMVPRLSGQQVQYLAWQLKQFKAHTRADPDAQIYMWPVAQAMGQKEIQSVAKYYAAQTPMHSTSSTRSGVSAGKQIFLQGIVAQGVPACMACHAVNATGRGIFPRLAGQRYGYIVQQLTYLHDGNRVNPIMQPVAKKLTNRQMQDVAAYLSGLHGDQ